MTQSNWCRASCVSCAALSIPTACRSTYRAKSCSKANKSALSNPAQWKKSWVCWKIWLKTTPKTTKNSGNNSVTSLKKARSKITKTRIVSPNCYASRLPIPTTKPKMFRWLITSVVWRKVRKKSTSSLPTALPLQKTVRIWKCSVKKASKSCY